MTLLEPWGAVVAGTVGLAVLTLLYVLKLRRKALRVGSTMLWEQALAEVEVNTPWKRLRIDWMFLLQALAIACLAVAIGRPALGIGSARQRVVVVIDASASMAAIDAGTAGTRTRLDEAKRLALEMVENLRRAHGFEGAVVSFGREAQVIRGFSQQTAGVLEGIQEVKQSDEPGDLQAAMDAVAALTAGAAAQEEPESREGTVAYVFSDGGFPGTPVSRPGGVAVKLVRIGPEPEKRTGNFGIVSISAQRDDADPATVSVVARLLSTFPVERGVSLRVLLDDETVGSSTANLPALGEQTVVLPVSVRRGGVLTLRVMNDDALASDNAARIVIDGAREAAVVVIGPGVNGEGADPLVVNFAQSVSPKSRVVGIETLGRDAAAGGDPWSGVDLLIFDRVEPAARPQSLPPVASVSLGAGLRAAGVTLEPTPASAPPVERVIAWKRGHPLMRDVVLDGLVLKRPGTLKLPDRALPLAEGVRGPLIGLIEGPDGIGRVVSALSAEQGGWGSDLSFVVFMGNTMDYLTLRGRAKAGRQVAAGDAMSVRVPRGAAAVTVVRPDGVERQVDVPVPSADPGSQVVVGLGRADRAGVYGVRGAVEGEDRVAVNVDSAAESGLETSDTLPLRGSTGTDPAAAGGKSGTRPREVWDWFVLGALGVLGAEWLVYAVLSRR